MNRPLRCLAACLLVSLAMPASAAIFDFSYLTRDDDTFGRPPVSAAGRITADLFAGNSYTISNITGTRAGAAITGFDDIDTIQSFTLSGGGGVESADFAYRIGDVIYNVFGGPFIFTENPIDFDLTQIEPARTLAQLTITPAVTPVPELATWAMMIMGLGIAGVAVRRRRAAALA